MTKPKSKTKQIDPDNGTEESNAAAFGMAEILNEIRAFRTETSGNFVALRKEVSDLRKELGDIKKRMDAAEHRLSESEDNERNSTRVMIHMLQQQTLLKEKCEDLESRSRRNNIRIYSVPEKSEGNNMIDFVSNLIREQLGVTVELRIERAHSISVPKRPGQYERPRSIMVLFQSFATKQNVLKAAWMKKIVQVNGNRIYFDEDFTPAVYKERGKYNGVRKVLRERKIKHRILFPAKLKIFCEDGN